MTSLFRTLKGLALAFGLAAAMPAAAQVNRTFQPVGTPQSAGPIEPVGTAAPPSTELSRNLTILANNPTSVAALTGAGRAALQMDDPDAALNFFARAEELEPQDGRIKASIGTALVLMDQAEPALRFFEEAQRLGAPEAELAADRGLAFDLTGNPQRAQRDYQTFLRRNDNAEVRRRLALSLAISGNRDAAIATIDEQLRKQDRAAWRVRAFILALTGDVDGANEAVRAAMPAQAASMAPFLTRLPSLSSAERARAVHLGFFPGEKRVPTTVNVASVAPPLHTTPPTTPLPSSPPVANSVIAAGRPDPSQRPLGLLPPPATVPPGGFTPIAPTRPPDAPAPAVAQRPPVPAAPRPAPAPAKEPVSRTSALAAVVADLRDPPAGGPKSTAKPVPAAPAKEKDSKAARDAKDAKDKKDSKDPARAWVQLAHAATPDPLDKSYRQIKGKAPKLLAAREAWVAPQRGNARLLIGPFKSAKEARDFADKLEKADVTTLVWTSPAGQKVERLGD